MSAGNAFAQRVESRAPQETGFVLRECNEDTGLEVDVLILEFLVHQAQTACLRSRRVEPAGFGADTGAADQGISLKLNILMADWFRKLFRVRHPVFRPDRELRFRSDLLQLTALFAQRLTRNPMTPSREDLGRLRLQNQERAKAWIAVAERVPSLPWEAKAEIYEKQLPLPLKELERNRAQVLYALGLPAENETDDDDDDGAFLGTPACVSLLDLLPLFMRVSAQRNEMADSIVTQSWLNLAMTFMLQASLEQFLVFGASGTDAIDEAFAWGYKPDDDDDDDAADEANPAALVNDLFVHPDLAEENPAWLELRSAALALLFPSALSQPNPTATPASHQPPSSPLPHVLSQLAARHPMRVFENAVFAFLAALHGSLQPPVLAQPVASAHMKGH